MAKAAPNKLVIGRNDRVFIVGTTGSGKTSLSKAMLYGKPNVVVLDPKRTFTLPEAWPHSIYTDMGKLSEHPDTTTAIYRPEIAEMEKGCEEFFEWIFERGNTLAYIDEVMRVTNAHRIGRGYATILQLGRERGISCWSATQRPANIPLVIMTESEHYFVFRLRNEDDRKRLYSYTGAYEFIRIPRDEHGFYYYNDRTGKIIYYKGADLGKAA